MALNDPKDASLRGVAVESYLKDSVTLDPEALDEEMVRLPADYAYWNELHSVAFRQYHAAKMNEDMVRAARRMELREEKLDDKGKGPTVGDLDAMVATDADVQQAQLDTIEAETEMKRLKGVLDALSMKRDMVQSIGARLRIEMMSDPMVREQVEQARAVRRERG